MTIATLEIIHRLLTREHDSLYSQYKAALATRNNVDYDDPCYPELDKVARDASHLHSDVRDALLDFESKEW